VANAVEAGVDVIEHCTFIEADGDGIRHVFREDIARDMVRKDIVADNVVIAMNDRDRLEWCFQNFRGLRRLGAKIVAGTDGLGLYKTAGLPVVLEMMVRAGDEPMDAIRAATTMAAEVCGLETVGSLEVGKEADLIVVEGDPLDNIRVLRSPSLVMKGGVIIARTKIVKEYRREYNSVFEEYDKILNLWNEVAATY
jgi:imidazolonepropionase-like amidohydrolase